MQTDLRDIPQINLEPLKLVRFPMSKYAYLVSRMADAKPVPGYPGKRINCIVNFSGLDFCGVQFHDTNGGSMESKRDSEAGNSGDKKPKDEAGKVAGCSGNCSSGNCESRGAVQQNVRETFARGQDNLP